MPPLQAVPPESAHTTLPPPPFSPSYTPAGGIARGCVLSLEVEFVNEVRCAGSLLYRNNMVVPCCHSIFSIKVAHSAARPTAGSDTILAVK